MSVNKYMIIFLALWFTGCAIEKQSKKTHMPEPPQLDSAFAKEQQISHKLNNSQPVVEWWKQLDDPQLHYLVDSAINHNLDVKIAVANVLKSRAVVNEVEADRIPTIDTNASYRRERFSEEGVFGDFGGNENSVYSAGFDAFWELDLFGRVQQRIDRSQALNAQAVADLRLAHTTVVAEIARNYIVLRGGQYQWNIAKRNVQNQEKTYELTRNMVKNGRGTKFDAIRAKSQLELTASQIPEIEAAIYRSIRRLSVLTGEVPNALISKLSVVKPLPDIPQSIAIGDPQGLLRRRADIKKAEEALAQAFAEYNLAYADIFPEITLQGSLGFVATAFGRWATGGALETSFGPSIRWKILDIKRILARIHQSDAETKNKILRYQKTILEALEEVENAIGDFSKEEQKRLNLVRAVKASAVAVDIARQRFQAGVDPLINVLDAQKTQLEAESLLAKSETNLSLQLINIYKALGGGWKIAK